MIGVQRPLNRVLLGRRRRDLAIAGGARIADQRRRGRLGCCGKAQRIERHRAGRGLTVIFLKKQ